MFLEGLQVVRVSHGCIPTNTEYKMRSTHCQALCHYCFYTQSPRGNMRMERGYLLTLRTQLGADLSNWCKGGYPTGLPACFLAISELSELYDIMKSWEKDKKVTGVDMIVHWGE